MVIVNSLTPQNKIPKREERKPLALPAKHETGYYKEKNISGRRHTVLEKTF
jgi:hypothetical protein